MRDHASAGTETAPATADASSSRAPASSAQARAGQSAVDRMLSHLTGKELANKLAVAAPSEVGSILDGAQTSGELGDAVRQLTAAQSLGFLQPALRAITGDPLTTLRKETLQTIFDFTPDAFSITLMAVFKVRFGLDRVGLKAGEGELWDVKGLRDTWGVLVQLPEAQVVNRPELRAIVRPRGAQTGVYETGNNQIDLPQADRKFDIYSAPNPAEKGDPLDGVNWFDETVRHEVGHAVDARINASGGYCTTESGGGWQMYNSSTQVLLALYQNLGLPLPTNLATPTPAPIDGSTIAPNDHPEMPGKAQHKAKEQAHHKKKVVDHIAAEPNEPIDQMMFDELLAFLQSNHPGEVERSLVKHQAELQQLGILDGVKQVFHLIGAGLKEWSSPWNLEGGGTMKAGSRTFFGDQQMNVFGSYSTAARDRKVSTYQFRSPYEWFAECYAAYYAPESKGTGALLGQRDPATKAWFDANVATLKSETKVDPNAANAGAK